MRARGRAGPRAIRVRAYKIILYMIDLVEQNAGTARAAREVHITLKMEYYAGFEIAPIP